MKRVIEAPHAGTRTGAGSGGGTGETVMITTLTSRERDVATLVAKGLSNKQVALHLNLEEATVKVHLRKIFTKMVVKNRPLLAVMIHREGARQALRHPAVLGSLD